MSEFPPSKAEQAARWLLCENQQLSQLHERGRTRRDKKVKLLTVRDAAAKFNVAKSHVGRQYKAIRETGLSVPCSGPVGRPPSLTSAEDYALEAYAHFLIVTGLLCMKETMVAAANLLRSRRKVPAGPVRHQWWSTWLKDHPWFATRRLKPVEVERLSQEEQAENVVKFFDKVEALHDEYPLDGSSVWNSDECGARIGVLAHQVKILVHRIERVHRVRLPFSLYKQTPLF